MVRCNKVPNCPVKDCSHYEPHNRITDDECWFIDDVRFCTQWGLCIDANKKVRCTKE